MAEEHLEGPVKILCGREEQYIGDHDADGDTSTMRIDICRLRWPIYGTFRQQNYKIVQLLLFRTY